MRLFDGDFDLFGDVLELGGGYNHEEHLVVDHFTHCRHRRYSLIEKLSLNCAAFLLEDTGFLQLVAELGASGDLERLWFTFWLHDLLLLHFRMKHLILFILTQATEGLEKVHIVGIRIFLLSLESHVFPAAWRLRIPQAALFKQGVLLCSEVYWTCFALDFYLSCWLRLLSRLHLVHSVTLLPQEILFHLCHFLSHIRGFL